jgi:phage-related protein
LHHAPKLAPGEKPLFWIGSSKRDLLAMPDSVVRQMGAALGVAQYGGKHLDVKPWKGVGSGAIEVVSDFKTDTFRAGYVARSNKRYTYYTVFRGNHRVERALRRRMLN